MSPSLRPDYISMVFSPEPRIYGDGVAFRIHRSAEWIDTPDGRGRRTGRYVFTIDLSIESFKSEGPTPNEARDQLRAVMMKKIELLTQAVTALERMDLDAKL